MASDSVFPVVAYCNGTNDDHPEVPKWERKKVTDLDTTSPIVFFVSSLHYNKDIAHVSGITPDGTTVMVNVHLASAIVLSIQCWFEIQAGDWSIATNRISTCQLEIDCRRGTDLNPMPPREPLLRVHTFDVECIINDTRLPLVEEDPISMIVAKQQSPIGGEQQVCFVVTHQISTSSNADLEADVRRYDTETDMLRGYCQFLLEFDPDVVTCKTYDFDFHYLFGRIDHLGLKDELDKLSRISGLPTTSFIRTSTRGSRRIFDIPGRFTNPLDTRG